MMPILANLSRRLSLFTTDAKPDPPRTGITESTHNSRATNAEITPPTSHTPDGDTLDAADILKQQPTSEPSSKSDTESEQKKPRVKRKTAKNATNVINYNIINSSGVKIGATNTYICNINQHNADNFDQGSNQSHSQKKTVPRPMPDHVKVLSMSQKLLTAEDMYHIKSHVGSNWRELFTLLGFSQGQLDQFQENYKAKGIDEVIYQTLLDWKQANGRGAYIGIILKALWQSQEYECADRLIDAQNLS